MSELLSELTSHYDLLTLAFIAVLSFVLSIFHTFNGFAGGLLLAIFIAPIIGVRAIIPVMAIAMTIDHSVRMWIFRHDFQWRPFFMITLLGVPGIIAGATVYSFMDTSAIALLLAVFLAISVPARRYLHDRNIHVSDTGLVIAGGGWGLISGPTVGPGIFLVPFLLGAGLTSEAFIAMINATALVANALKSAVFSKFALLTPENLAVGILIAASSIPGTYIGRWILSKTPVRVHVGFVEAIVFLGALNFLWIAAKDFGWIQ